MKYTSQRSKNQTLEVWSQAKWAQVEEETRTRALAAHTEEEAWEILVKQARSVLKHYSTSFFLVTRFLPPSTRAKVEVIYAAVRYPDEIVDSLSVSQVQRTLLLHQWEEQYDAALGAKTVRESLEYGAPGFIAGFAEVVRSKEIPIEHYRAFLDAMRMDVWPRKFETLDDLIENY